MDKTDLELIIKCSEQDAELKGLYDEHISYGKIIEKLENKAYLSPTETLEIKELKKKKLAGKTRMEALLIKYRKGD